MRFVSTARVSHETAPLDRQKLESLSDNHRTTHLRRRLEAERDGEGTCEYIRVLRLLEKHPLAQLRPAVEQGLKAGALTRDAIAQFLYPPPDWRLALFSLAGHPSL